jgi:hypothetical protein
LWSDNKIPQYFSGAGRFTGSAEKKAALVAGVPVKRVGKNESVASAARLYIVARCLEAET